MPEWLTTIILALLLLCFVVDVFLFIISKIAPGYRDSTTFRENSFQTALRRFKEWRTKKNQK